jgi:hypothetical protein
MSLSSPRQRDNCGCLRNPLGWFWVLRSLCALGVWCIPMREWITFVQHLKKGPAISARQVSQKVVHPRVCAFVELLHLGVGE